MSETKFSNLMFHLNVIHNGHLPKTDKLEMYQKLRKIIANEYRTGNITGSQVLDLMDKLNHYIDIDIWERG